MICCRRAGNGNSCPEILVVLDRVGPVYAERERCVDASLGTPFAGTDSFLEPLKLHPRLWRILRWICTVIATALIVGAEVGPTDAASNLAKWIEFLGIKNIPSVIAAKSADHYVALAAWAILSVCVVSWGVEYFLYKRARVSAPVLTPAAPLVQPAPSPIVDLPVLQPSSAPIAEGPVVPSPPATPEPSIPKVPAKPLRIFVDSHVTPEFLMGLYEGNTTLRAETLISEQIGKWMTVSGPLGEIHPGRIFGTFPKNADVGRICI
jgi:hypothetical protein